MTIEKNSSDPSTKRIVLVSLNMVGVLLIGLAVVLIIISTFFLTVYKNDYVFFQSFQNKITLSFVSLGILSLITGILGFYSIYWKNYLFIPLLIIGMLLLCMLLVGLGTWAFIVGDDSSGSLLIEVEKTFNQTILSYDESGQEESMDKKNLDFFQKEFNCCGWTSYKDWKMCLNINSLKPILQYKFLLNSNQIEINVPDTCCVNMYPSCGKDYTLNKTIFNQGCKHPLKSLLSHLRIFVFGVSLALAFSYLLAAIFFTLVITIFHGEYNLLDLIQEDEDKKARQKSQRRLKKGVSRRKNESDDESVYIQTVILEQSQD